MRQSERERERDGDGEERNVGLSVRPVLRVRQRKNNNSYH